MRESGKMHHGADAGHDVMPLRRRQIAQRDARLATHVGPGQSAHDADMGNASRDESRAQRPADESRCTRNEHFSREWRGYAHFQPCLLKNRTALRAKYTTCRHPLRAAPPP